MLVGFGGVHVEALADVRYLCRPSTPPRRAQVSGAPEAAALLLHRSALQVAAGRGRILQDGSRSFPR